MKFASVPKTVVSLTLAMVCVGCRPLISHDEVARASSPDNRIDAVLFETNGGATTSFGYEVELGNKDSQRGQRVARLYGANRNAQAYGANLRWKNKNTLVIEYLETKTPPEVQNSIHVDGHDVQIILRPGVEDLTAPSGSMLYNLHKH